ncbi:MAG: amidase, partial [Chloroflexi bacterium]|nr:amidase [Chloroflexota bacterium]
MANEIHWLTTTELAVRIRNKQLSPVEVLQAHLDRIAAVNPKLNAVVTMTGDAMDKARAAEDAVMSGKRLGPLHGVPFTAKDTFDTAGVRTTVGSLLYKDNIPATDSTTVARLKQAGAILVGKTNTPEFALDSQTDNRVFGRTNNPWNLDRIPSGSSGGAATALAAGMTPFEIGSDVGGSIRVPATYCNIVGFKPTHGRVPLTGHNPAAILRYMHIGPMSRTVRDNALILGIIAGPDGRDPFAVNIPVPKTPDLAAPLPKKLRIAFSPEDGYAPVDRQVQAVVVNAAAALGEQGYTVEQVELPWLKKRDYMAAGLEVMLADAVHFATPIVTGREADLTDS